MIFASLCQRAGDLEDLISQDFSRGRSIIARLDHGGEFITEIVSIAASKRITNASFQAVGAFSHAELAYYDQIERFYRKIAVNEPVELVVCQGNISLRDGVQFAHAHAVLGRRDGTLLGGHLNSGKIFAAEIFIEELEGRPLIRKYDPVTGLYLWGEED